jgi:DHA1 family bicyclomycin/chloramphenicol resistance-like MFS transporter
MSMTAKPAQKRVSLILILGALTAVTALSIDMYLPAFPAIAHDLDTSPGAVQTTLAVFLIGLAIGQLIFGPLSDRFGRIRPLLAGLTIYIGASIAAAFAPDITTLTIARFVEALGGCSAVVISRAMVRDLFDTQTSAQVFSTLILVMGVAPILAPLAGGFLLELASWRAIFLALAAFGLFCMISVKLKLGETLHPEKRSSGEILHVLQSYLALFRNKHFIFLALSGGLAMSSMFAYITGSSFAFISLYGLTPQQFSIAFGINATGLIAASQINARLLRYYPLKRVLGTAILVNVGLVSVLLFTQLTGFGGLWGFAIPILLITTTFGFVGPNSVAMAMGHAGQYLGAASALVGVMQFFFASVAGAIIGLLNDGTALPMVAMMALLTYSGAICFRIGR